MTPRRYYVAGLLLLIAAGGAAGYAYWGTSKPDAAYRFAKIESGSITAAVSATGTLNPVVSVQVGSQVSGQLKEILVDYNSQVKKGQLIARIDPESFALRVNQAMADVEAARATVLTQRANIAALQADVSRTKAGLADAEREYERNKMLYEKNFVSAAVRDKSLTALEMAREQVNTSRAQLGVGEAQIRNGEALVKQRESQLSQAKVDLDRTMIRAPVDGIVVKKSVEPGQTVAASLQAPELFVIAQDLREMQVETSIDEAEIGRVRVGQSASFTVDSFPGRAFRGTVSQVRKAAQVVQNVVTYIAVIGASNADLSLFPGMTANVRIVVDTRENVLKIPNAALRYRPPGVADTRQAATPAAELPSKGGGGQQAGQARERLTKELNLSAEQQAKVETIFNETRDKIRAIATEDQNERRRLSEKLRADSRTRISEILNPEQRARYEEMSASRAAGGVASGRVWIQDHSKPKMIAVRTGLTDGSYTELVSGELAAGAQVIIGVADSSKKQGQPAPGPRFGF